MIVDVLRRLVESGLSLRAAGQRVGVSATTAYRRVRSLGDGVVRRRRRPVERADRRRIVRMAEAGEVSIRRIASRVNRSWHTVRRVLDARADLPRSIAPVRCPGCGYRIVLLPCQICHAESSKVDREAKDEGKANECCDSRLWSPLASYC